MSASVCGVRVCGSEYVGYANQWFWFVFLYVVLYVGFEFVVFEI